MVKIGYKVLLAADVWTYTPRTLTKITGTPRSDLVGADENIYTRLDEKVSSIEAFDHTIPAVPVAGTWGEKFKPFVNPKCIIIPFYHAPHERARLTVANVGTSWKWIPYQYVPIDFTEIEAARIGIIARVRGNEAGTKGIRIYNLTDAKEIASTTWSGTAETVVSAFADITLTGVKMIGVQWYGSSATEDIELETLWLVIKRAVA